uniref:CTCHY-type domain-containing protein n=1 Tax=Callorhinchus milii TaxID=7868 RepID=A0A4W3IJT8_CALMI
CQAMHGCKRRCSKLNALFPRSGNFCSDMHARHFCFLKTVFGDRYYGTYNLHHVNEKWYHFVSCGICRTDPKETYFQRTKYKLCFPIDLHGNCNYVEKASRWICSVFKEEVHSFCIGSTLWSLFSQYLHLAMTVNVLHDTLDITCIGCTAYIIAQDGKHVSQSARGIRL